MLTGDHDVLFFFAVLFPRVLYVCSCLKVWYIILIRLHLFFQFVSWRHSSMAPWVILIVSWCSPLLPSSVGADYDLQSLVVASVLTALQPGWGILPLLHVVPGCPCWSCLKWTLLPLCRSVKKSENIGVGVFGILYRHKINQNPSL